MPRTLYDKIWEDHLVDEQPDGTCLIYIDRHLVHEVTSPQAFEGLGLARPKAAGPAQSSVRRTRRCWWSTTTSPPPTAASPIRTPKAPPRSPISRRTPSCS